jgi:hypothetical protein
METVIYGVFYFYFLFITAPNLKQALSTSPCLLCSASAVLGLSIGWINSTAAFVFSTT